MKTKTWLLRTLCAALVLICASSAGAQTTNSNNLTVLGYLDVTNNIAFGTTGTNSAILLYYTDSNHTVGFLSTQPSSSYLWQDNGVGTSKNKLLLDGSNNLTLYGTNGSNGIVLNPNTGGIKLAGTGSGITLGDGTVLSNAASFHSTALYDGSGNQILSFSSGTLNGTTSVAFGSSRASGNSSAAFGYGPSASGAASAAFGVYTQASGSASFAAGASTVASGTAAAAFGVNTAAIGYASFAAGGSSKAQGDYSTAFGETTTAASYASLSFGQYNVGLVSTNGATNWMPTDPVLEIGNGASGAPSNAVTIFKSGEVRSHGLVQSQSGFRTPPTGNLSMGSYTNGANPATLNPATGLRYPGGN